MSATQRLGAPVHVRAASRDNRTIEIVASDFSKDSYNTRIDPNGWDLTQFVKNSVILAFHNDYKFPVARALPDTIRTEGGELRMTIQFPEKGKYAEADIAFELYADGFMRGVSVGFMPLDWEDVEEGEGENRQSIRVYRKVKLLEVSLVPIPSNDNALSQRAIDLNADVEDVKGRMETLERMLDEKGQLDLEEYEKYRAYYEKKQPANRAATKVLERFYKRIMKEEAPADEVEAWERMSEAIESMEETEETEQKTEEEIEETPEVIPEEIVEEPTPPVTEPAEAPPAAPEAPVQLSLDVLSKLPGAIAQACTEAVVKASRQGMPPSEWDAVIETTGRQFLVALSKSPPLG